MPKKLALLIGVDKYSNLEPQYQLAGCVNDAKLMKSVLVGHFNFGPADITELHNERASRDAILAHMNRLGEAAGKDDIVVFHFSGHGSQRTALDSDEAMGLDSTIMPADSGRDPLPNLDIVDDEIREWLGRLAQKTHNISLTFDCCHSGTITRDAFGAKARSVSADNRSLEAMGIDPTRLPSLRKTTARAAGQSRWLELSEAYVVISGCRDDELSYEFERADGAAVIKGGALTYFLTTALVNAKPGTTYRDVFERARRDVNTKFATQHPQLEGAQDREIFGVRDIEPLNFVPIVAVSGEHVTLGGGGAHGLCAGSRWAVYPEGTKQTEGITPLATIEITNVGALTAEGVIRERHGDIELGARCVEQAPAASQYVLRVDLAALDAEVRAAFAARVEQSNLLAVAQTPAAADVRVYVLEPRARTSAGSPVPQVEKVHVPTWAIVDLEGGLAMPLHAVGEPNVVDTLVGNLEATARYRNALRLDNPASNLKVEFNVYRESLQGELQKANGGDFLFDEGDCLVFEVVNKEDIPVFVSVLDFGLTGKISLLYPPNKTSERVAAGQSLRLGTGGKLRLGMPKDLAADRGTETLKALVTTAEADFRWLQQGGMRSHDGARSRLRRQFEAAYDGPSTREAYFADSADQDERWISIARSFEVRRRAV